jgi:PncC family amidohydrolase
MAQRKTLGGRLIMDELFAQAAKVGEKLKARGQTVAVAESAAGGLISATLLAVPGASAYYTGGTVVYTIKARTELLGLTREQLKELAPVTEDYCAACADAVRDKLGADWGISELGIAGPTGSRYGHDAGVAALAITGPVSKRQRLETGHNDRARNMQEFASAALALLDAALEE